MTSETEEALWDPLNANGLKGDDENEDISSRRLSILEIGSQVAHIQQQQQIAAEQAAANGPHWITCFSIVKFDTDYGPSK
jgi:hypothetical protein